MRGEGGSFSGPGEVSTLIRVLWQADPAPPIAAVLSPAVRSDESVLAEAVAADVEARSARGLDVRIEAYLEACPELAGSSESCRAVLMAEVARRSGEPLEAIARDLTRRVPSLEPQIGAVIELAGLLRDVEAEHHAGAGHREGTRVGKYILVQRLGAGAFGETWRALDTRLNRDVALKLLRHDAPMGHRGVERCLDEARAAAGLDHECVVRVHEAGQVPETGELFIDTQLVGDHEGTAGPRTVEDLVRAGPTPARRAAEIVADAARGLAAAHARGLTHRDVKPANILLSRGGRAMLADFGMATPTATPAGGAVVAGTPAYMAPEVARGEGASPLSDVFSLGCVLRALLTGTTPRSPPNPGEGDSAGQVLSLARGTPLPGFRLANVGPMGALAHIAQRATEMDPTRRYASAERFAADLDALLRLRPTEALPLGPVGRGRLMVRRHPVSSLLVAAAVSLLIGGAAVFVSKITMERDRARAAEQRADRQRDEAVRARDVLSSVNSYMARVFNSIIGLKPRGEVTIADALHLAARRNDTAFAGRPALEAAARHFVGQVALGSSEFDIAGRELTRALELRREYLGEHHPDTLSTLRQVADVYARLDMPAEAESLAWSVITGLNDPAGQEQPDTLWSLVYIGTRSMARGETARARDLLERSVSRYRDLGNAESWDRQRALNMLVVLELRERRTDRTIELQREIVEMISSTLGPDDISTLNATQALGQFYANRGRTADAVALYRDVLDRYERTAGKNHPGWMFVAIELTLATARTEPARALRLAVDLSGVTRTLAESSIYRLRGNIALGRALMACGATVAAEAPLTAAWRGCLVYRGPTHPHTAEAVAALAEALDRLGRPNDARRVRRSTDPRRDPAP